MNCSLLIHFWSYLPQRQKGRKIFASLCLSVWELPYMSNIGRLYALSLQTSWAWNWTTKRVHILLYQSTSSPNLGSYKLFLNYLAEQRNAAIQKSMELFEHHQQRGAQQVVRCSSTSTRQGAGTLLTSARTTHWCRVDPHIYQPRPVREQDSRARTSCQVRMKFKSPPLSMSFKSPWPRYLFRKHADGSAQHHIQRGVEPHERTGPYLWSEIEIERL